jgi:hypothetical protein
MFVYRNRWPVIAAVIVVWIGWAAAQSPPFPFGPAVGDAFTGPSDEGFSSLLALPQPMTYFGTPITAVSQGVNGFLQLFLNSTDASGAINPYSMDLDTRNGGANQNQLWLRVGSRKSDLTLARKIIARTGTFFIPQVAVVATWFKVEAFERLSGPQNTFQLILAYNRAGTTWAILAYAQLEYFASTVGSFADVFLTDSVLIGGARQQIALVNSVDSMHQLLNGTNCNRPGTYAFPIDSSPTNAPQQCGLLGRSIFCLLTFCGIFGRLLGLCKVA